MGHPKLPNNYRAYNGIRCDTLELELANEVCSGALASLMQAIRTKVPKGDVALVTAINGPDRIDMDHLVWKTIPKGYHEISDKEIKWWLLPEARQQFPDEHHCLVHVVFTN